MDRLLFRPADEAQGARGLKGRRTPAKQVLSVGRRVSSLPSVITTSTSISISISISPL